MALIRSRGFTLVELMVVVAMTGILIGATVPLGALWISGAKISKVEGALTEAAGKAKNIAIRNQHLASEGEPVTAICLTSSTLKLQTRTSTTAPSCGTPHTGDNLWNAELHEAVTVGPNNNSINCICFDSSGLLTNNDSCSACLNYNAVELTAGSKSELLYIY